MLKASAYISTPGGLLEDWRFKQPHPLQSKLRSDGWTFGFKDQMEKESTLDPKPETHNPIHLLQNPKSLQALLL